MSTTPAPKGMASRERKEAAKRLGIALQAKFRAMLEAEGQKEISLAAVDLGALFNQNIEFICWVLKDYGGVQQMPFPRQTKPLPVNDTQRPVAANDVPAMPAVFNAPTLPAAKCACPPIEPGIIGGNRHMTACPLFEPLA